MASLPEELYVIVEQLDAAGRVERLIARCANVPMGRGAFAAAVRLEPHGRFIVRERARIIDKHNYD